MDNKQGNSTHQKQVALRWRKQCTVLYAIGAIFVVLLVLCIILAATKGAAPDVPDDPQPTASVAPSDTPASSPTDKPPSETPTASPTPSRATYTVSLPSSAIHCGNLAIVSQKYTYQAVAVPTEMQKDYGELVNIYNTLSARGEIGTHYQLAGSSLQMRSVAFEAMNRMLTDFYNANDKNDTVLVSSAYRSVEQQDASGSSIKGGKSDTHLGLSCELKVISGGNTGYLSDSPVYNWLFEHCAEYGFIVRYPEKHASLTGVSDYGYYFRFVGVPHAAYIDQNGSCLEAYDDSFVKLQDTVYNPLTLRVGNVQYELYYVTATRDTTQIPIPEGYDYSISGDNYLGFIVTCWPK